MPLIAHLISLENLYVFLVSAAQGHSLILDEYQFHVKDCLAHSLFMSETQPHARLSSGKPGISILSVHF